MDIFQLDASVHHYCLLDTVPTMRKTYQAAIRQFMLFCTKYSVMDPFPVNELLVCRFYVEMAGQGVAPTTPKTYLTGIRHAQIMRGSLSCHKQRDNAKTETTANRHNTRQGI